MIKLVCKKIQIDRRGIQKPFSRIDPKTMPVKWNARFIFKINRKGRKGGF